MPMCLNRFGWLRRWGRSALAATAVLCAGLGGCAGRRSDMLTQALRQQILMPPGADLRGALPGGQAPSKTEAPSADQPDETLPPPRPVGPSTPPKDTARDTAKNFGALTLARALELTLRYNPRVQFMRIRIEQARAGEEVAFAEFLPTAAAKSRYINGGPSTFIVPTRPAPNSVGVVAFGNSVHQHELTESYLQWLVYDFGRRKGRYQQATLAIEIAELQYRRAVQTAQFNVTAAYFELLRTQALLRVAEEDVRRTESNLRDARNLLGKGLAVRNDVMRAEVLLGDARLRLVSAQRAVGVARAALNEAIGINVSGATEVADLKQEPNVSLVLADLLRLAADNRPEFAAALRAIRSAQAGRGVAAAEFAPRINVDGGANVLGPEDQGKALMYGEVSFAIDLFEGGRRLGRLHQADAAVRGAVAEGQDICNRIALEVNTAWYEVEETRQRIELARTTLAQATEDLRVIRELFRRGEAVPTEVADVDVVYVRAQQDEATALYAYQTALARLAYDIGVSLEQLLVLGCSNRGLTPPARQAGADATKKDSTTPPAVNKAR